MLCYILAVVRRTALILIGLLGTLTPLLAQEAKLHITGEVSYRERLALPAGASLRMALIDLANPKSIELLAASATIANTGQVPLQFDFAVQSEALKTNRTLGVTAQIIANNQIWFASSSPQPLNLAAPTNLSLILSMAQVVEPPTSPLAPNASAQLAIKANLFNTDFSIISIANHPVLSQAIPSLHIASDRRVGGTAGCNHYFAEAEIHNQNLSFGPLASTKMACAPAIMVQEASMFAALANVIHYHWRNGELILSGADNTPLLTLIPTPR